MSWPSRAQVSVEAQDGRGHRSFVFPERRVGESQSTGPRRGRSPGPIWGSLQRGHRLPCTLLGHEPPPHHHQCL